MGRVRLVAGRIGGILPLLEVVIVVERPAGGPAEYPFLSEPNRTGRAQRHVWRGDQKEHEDP